jgi:hypothetical protein
VLTLVLVVVLVVVLVLIVEGGSRAAPTHAVASACFDRLTARP